MLCLIRSVRADDSFREDLFRDCNSAIKKFSLVTPEDRLEALDYLTRVLTLNTAAPDVVEAFVIPPGGGTRTRELNSGTLWQSVDARRELIAKRCALELFEIAGRDAIHQLPNLVRIYAQQNLGDELTVWLEEVIAEIAEDAHLAGIEPSVLEFDQMIPDLLDPHPLVVGNVIAEFRDIAFPRVLKFLSTLPEDDVRHFMENLPDLEDQPSSTLRAVLSLGDEIGPTGLSRLVNVLALPRAQELIEFAPEVAFEAATLDPTIGQPFARLLGRICTGLGSVQLPTEIAALIATRPVVSILEEGYLPSDHQICLARSVPGLAENIVHTLRDGRDSELQSVLELLPHVTGNLSSKGREIAYRRVRQLSFESTSVLRFDAMLSLASFRDRQVDAAAILAQLTRAAPIPRSGEGHVPLRRGIVRAISALTDNRVLTRFVPFLIDTATKGIDRDTIVMTLRRGDSSMGAALMKVYRTGSPEARKVAAASLGEGMQPSDADLKELATGIQNGDVQDEIEKAFLRLGSRTQNPIRKSLARIKGINRLPLLRLLVRLRVASPAEKYEFDELLADMPCEQIVKESPWIDSIVLASSDQNQVSTKFAHAIAICLPTAPGRSAAQLLEAIPATQVLDDPTLDTLVANDEGHITGVLIDRVEGDPAMRDALLRKIFSQGSAAAKRIALHRLPNPVPSDILKAVRDLASKDGAGNELLTWARLSLATAGDVEFDWARFLRDTMDQIGHGHEDELWIKTIKALPPERILPEVTEALKSSDIPMLIGAARVAGLLKDQGAPLIPRLIELQRNQSPGVAYSAVLARLEIDPHSKDLVDMLRRMLVNRYFSVAAGREIAWRECLAVEELGRENLGELRNGRLLALIRRNY